MGHGILSLCPFCQFFDTFQIWRPMKTTSQNKYRPTFTAPQLARILHLAQESYINAHTADICQIDRVIVQTLAPFIAKIESGVKEAAYALMPRTPIHDLLGFEINPGAKQKETVQNKVAYNAACYKIYSENPARCTVVQIEAAREHMYVNDLMSATQEKMYISTYRISLNSL